jgi:hypothetical protein
MTVEVKIVSAPWCKRCQIIKPEIQTHCAFQGVEPVWVNVDELEDSDEIKGLVASLPTLLVRTGSEAWQVFTFATFDAWKTAVSKNAAGMRDLDF